MLPDALEIGVREFSASSIHLRILEFSNLEFLGLKLLLAHLAHQGVITNDEIGDGPH
jgi:hypothetical protein